LKWIEFPSFYIIIIIISIIITKQLLFVVFSHQSQLLQFLSKYLYSGFMIHVWSEFDEIENVKKREKESDNKKGKISNRRYISHIECYSRRGRCCPAE
ncbi:hypothetical protein T09_7466, partial [Trichinella sp. T9]